MKKTGKNIGFMLRYAWKYTPFYLVLTCLFEIYSSIEVFFEFTYCTKYIVDLIQYGGTFYQAARYMAAITAAIIIKVVWASWMTHAVEPKGKERLHKQMQGELYEKAVQLDLARYDDPDCYNEFVFSVGEAGRRMDELIKDIAKLCRSVTSIVMVGVFFLSYDKAGIIFVSISLLITLAVNTKISKLTFQMDSALKPIERKRNYFSRVFYLADYAKELRVYPIGEKLREDYKETNDGVYPLVDTYGRKQTILTLIGGYAANSLIVDVFYLVYLLYQTVVRAAMSYGGLLSLYHASSALKDRLSDISSLLPRFQQHSLYIEKIRCFLAFEPEIAGGDKEAQEEKFEELSLRNVSFSYGKDQPILKDINLSVRAGEKIAIVGYNGAGKTTLIKLLMRLYHVSGGEICMNGVDICNYRTESYRNLFGSVFQDYKLYGASLAENVKMDAVIESDSKDIISALIQSGFQDKLEHLAQGIRTPLTREFEEEGVNLSGGEAQKVAIARVFYHSCPIIILDEPSSALDPISEYHLNRTILEAAKDKTVIVISHRLSSTKMADRIYMLEQGRIIEQGNHEELMRLDGKYAQMFHMQAEKYALG